MNHDAGYLGVPIQLAGRGHEYCVHIGPGLLGSVASMIAGAYPRPGRVCVVADAAVVSPYARPLVESLRAAGFDAAISTCVADEHEKTIATVERVCRDCAAHHLERGEPIIAIGGGVVGDVAGYVAASYKRGVPFYNIPTTLLSMVDASVGGKTGVNLEVDSSTMIKNAVGAFHQPNAVFADPRVLQSLDARVLRSGLAECIKHAIIGDPEMLAWITRHGASFETVPVEDQSKFIQANVSIKASVVQQDERESRLRMVLNLGHTFAHAVETIDALDLMHGEAVAVGLIAAAEAGVSLGLTDRTTVDAIRSAVAVTGLPVSLADLPADDVLIDRMRQDKKVGGGRIRLVIPRAVGDVEIVDDADEAAIAAGWNAVRS